MAQIKSLIKHLAPFLWLISIVYASFEKGLVRDLENLTINSLFELGEYESRVQRFRLVIDKLGVDDVDDFIFEHDDFTCEKINTYPDEIIPLALHKSNHITEGLCFWGKSGLIFNDILKHFFDSKIRKVAGFTIPSAWREEFRKNWNFFCIFGKIANERKQWNIKELLKDPEVCSKLVKQYFESQVELVTRLFEYESGIKLPKIPRSFSEFIEFLEEHKLQLQKQEQELKNWVKERFPSIDVETEDPSSLLEIYMLLSNSRYRDIFINKLDDQIKIFGVDVENSKVLLVAIKYLKETEDQCLMNPLEILPKPILYEMLALDDIDAITLFISSIKWINNLYTIQGDESSIFKKLPSWLEQLGIFPSRKSYGMIGGIPIPSFWYEMVLKDDGILLWKILGKIAKENNIGKLHNLLQERGWGNKVWRVAFEMKGKLMKKAFAEYPGFETLQNEEFFTFDDLSRRINELYQKKTRIDKIDAIEHSLPFFSETNPKTDQVFVNLKEWDDFYVDRLHVAILLPENRSLIKQVWIHPLIREDPMTFLCSPSDVKIQNWIICQLARSASEIGILYEHLRYILLVHQDFFLTQNEIPLDNSPGAWNRLLNVTHKQFLSRFNNHEDGVEKDNLVALIADQLGIYTTRTTFKDVSLEEVNSPTVFFPFMMHSCSRSWLKFENLDSEIPQEKVARFTHFLGLSRFVQHSREKLFIKMFFKNTDLLQNIPDNQTTPCLLEQFILADLLLSTVELFQFQRAILKALPESRRILSKYIEKFINNSSAKNSKRTWESVISFLGSNIDPEAWCSIAIKACHTLGKVCRVAEMKKPKNPVDPESLKQWLNEWINKKSIDIQTFMPFRSMNRRLFDLLYFHPMLLGLVLPQTFQLHLVDEDKIVRLFIDYLKNLPKESPLRSRSWYSFLIKSEKEHSILLGPLYQAIDKINNRNPEYRKPPLVPNIKTFDGYYRRLK